MVPILWVLLLVLIPAAGLIYLAGELRGQGVVWAYRLCLAAGGLCDHPSWLAVATAGVAVAYLVMRRIES